MLAFLTVLDMLLPFLPVFLERFFIHYIMQLWEEGRIGEVRSSLANLLKALKKPGAPETSSAGYPFNITVLLKIRIPDIIAESEAAVKAKRKLIPEHALPERAGLSIVPDVKDVPVAQIAEGPRLDPLFNASDIAVIAVPEEVTGMHVAIP